MNNNLPPLSNTFFVPLVSQGNRKSRMKYKKCTFEMKKKIVAEATQSKSIKSVSIKYDVAH